MISLNLNKENYVHHHRLMVIVFSLQIGLRENSHFHRKADININLMILSLKRNSNILVKIINSKFLISIIIFLINKFFKIILFITEKKVFYLNIWTKMLG